MFFVIAAVATQLQGCTPSSRLDAKIVAQYVRVAAVETDDDQNAAFFARYWFSRCLADRQNASPDIVKAVAGLLSKSLWRWTAMTALYEARNLEAARPHILRELTKRRAIHGTQIIIIRAHEAALECLLAKAERRLTDPEDCDFLLKDTDIAW